MAPKPETWNEVIRTSQLGGLVSRSKVRLQVAPGLGWGWGGGRHRLALEGPGENNTVLLSVPEKAFDK